MAGRRRARSNGRTEQTQRTARLERRREALAGRWATAQGAGERLVVAARYARNALRHQRDPRLERDTDRLALELVRLGDRALEPGRRHAA